jgi:hypothetical protein
MKNAIISTDWVRFGFMNDHEFKATSRAEFDPLQFLYRFLDSRTAITDQECDRYLQLTRESGIDVTTPISLLLYHPHLSDYQFEKLTDSVQGNDKLMAAARVERLHRKLLRGDSGMEFLVEVAESDSKELQDLMLRGEVPDEILELLATNSKFDSIKMIAKRKIRERKNILATNGGK